MFHYYIVYKLVIIIYNSLCIYPNDTLVFKKNLFKKIFALKLPLTIFYFFILFIFYFILKPETLY